MIHWSKPNEIHNFNHPVSWCEQSQWLIFEVINPNKDLLMLYGVGICGWIFFIRELGLGTCLTLSPFVDALFLFASPVVRLVKVGTRSELRQERHIVRRRECRCKSLCVANPKHSPANSQPVASPRVEMLSVCLYHREALDIWNHIDSCCLNNRQSILCSNQYRQQFSREMEVLTNMSSVLVNTSPVGTELPSACMLRFWFPTSCKKCARSLAFMVPTKQFSLKFFAMAGK